jgi:hypothetical protein
LQERTCLTSCAADSTQEILAATSGAEEGEAEGAAVVAEFADVELTYAWQAGEDYVTVDTEPQRGPLTTAQIERQQERERERGALPKTYSRVDPSQASSPDGSAVVELENTAKTEPKFSSQEKGVPKEKEKKEKEKEDKQAKLPSLKKARFSPDALVEGSSSIKLSLSSWCRVSLCLS